MVGFLWRVLKCDGRQPLNEGGYSEWRMYALFCVSHSFRRTILEERFPL